MKRLLWLLPLGFSFCSIFLFVAFSQSQGDEAEILPTLVVFPTSTPSETATTTPTPTLTSTYTPTPSITPTSVLTSTPTPTLAIRVLEISAVMPGVNIPPTKTPFPPGTILLSSPPLPLEPLPDATRQAPPYEGWYSFESDHPLVQYAPAWEPRQMIQASQGQYHRTEALSARMLFPFEGEGLRIRYITARNMGIFEILLDGVPLDTIDAYSSEFGFPATRIYILAKGIHVLEIRSAGKKNEQSEGYVIGLDAIQVFRGDANTLILTPPPVTSTPTPLPQPADVKLINAPPTLQPTATPMSPVLVNAAVVVAYDENGNKAVDPAEGVSSVPVRVVEAGTNRIVSHGITDSSGYVRLQVVTSVQTRVVVPYFGKFWNMPSGSRKGGEVQFVLLLTPGNQPGLIP